MTIIEARLTDRKFAFLAFGFLAVLIFLGWIVSITANIGAPSDRDSGERLFSKLLTDRTRILIETTDETYHLQFSDNAWRIPEKAGFPVNQEKIQAMLTAIQTAKFSAAKTALVGRHAQLGLSDPRKAGNGAIISLPETKAMPVVVGRRKETTYARFLSESQTWSVDTEFPALHSALWWLDLKDIGLPGPKPAAKIVIRNPRNAPPIEIDASNPDLSGDDRFLLQAAAGLKLRDVAMFDDASMKIFAQHDVQYRDGTELNIQLIRYQNAVWARFSGNALGAEPLTQGKVFKLEPISASELLPD